MVITIELSSTTVNFQYSDPEKNFHLAIALCKLTESGLGSDKITDLLSETIASELPTFDH